MAEVTEKQMSNRIKLIIAAAVIFVIAVIAILIAFIINIPKTATIEVIVAPSDAKILIGDKRYKNGTHKIEPGDYSVAVTRDDFSPYASEFTIGDGETKKILVCLNELNGNTRYSKLKLLSKLYNCRSISILSSTFQNGKFLHRKHNHILICDNISFKSVILLIIPIGTKLMERRHQRFAIYLIANPAFHSASPHTMCQLIVYHTALYSKSVFFRINNQKHKTGVT